MHGHSGPPGNGNSTETIAIVVDRSAFTSLSLQLPGS